MRFDYRVGGVQKGLNLDYVIFEWSLTKLYLFRGLEKDFLLSIIIYLSVMLNSNAGIH